MHIVKLYKLRTKTGLRWSTRKENDDFSDSIELNALCIGHCCSWRYRMVGPKSIDGWTLNYILQWDISCIKRFLECAVEKRGSTNKRLQHTMEIGWWLDGFNINYYHFLSFSLCVSRTLCPLAVFLNWTIFPVWHTHTTHPNREFHCFFSHKLLPVAIHYFPIWFI